MGILELGNGLLQRVFQNSPLNPKIPVYRYAVWGNYGWGGWFHSNRAEMVVAPSASIC